MYMYMYIIFICMYTLESQYKGKHVTSKIVSTLG